MALKMHEIAILVSYFDHPGDSQSYGCGSIPCTLVNILQMTQLVFVGIFVGMFTYLLLAGWL